MGYCRCTEFLYDVVENTVLNSGGKIVMREHRSSRQAKLSSSCMLRPCPLTAAAAAFDAFDASHGTTRLLYYINCGSLVAS